MQRWGILAAVTTNALGKNRIPVVVSVVTVLVNAALNYWLVHVMGYRGLALGTSAFSALEPSSKTNRASTSKD